MTDFSYRQFSDPQSMSSLERCVAQLREKRADAVEKWLSDCVRTECPEAHSLVTSGDAERGRELLMNGGYRIEHVIEEEWEVYTFYCGSIPLYRLRVKTPFGINQP